MMGISSRWLVVSVALVCACRIEVEEPQQHGALAESFGAEGGGILVPDGAYRAEPPCPTPLCSGQPEGAPAVSPVDQYPQLLVLDPQTLRGPRARNANPPELAPLSFRAQMSWLAGAREPFDFTRSWLAAWSSASRVGPAAAPVTPRPRATEVLHDGWLSAAGVPASGADAGAAAAPPSWSVAPFELIAVVNRVDLAAEACSGPAGELRYVYAALDPQTSEVLDVTLILEVPYPTTRPAADWARDWQELAGRAPAERPQALAELALAVQQAADPLRARLRSNEIALAEPEQPSWELREFRLAVQGGTLALVPAPLEFTPRSDVDPALLSQHVLAHADEIRSGAVSLPDELRAGAATTSGEDFSWPVLGVSEGLRQAFSRETCNGCHGGDTRTLPFRHIGPDPDLQRPAKLSRFLYDPPAESDDLRRRAARLEELAATFCETPTDGAAGYFGP
ncbi:MAG: hypothetical protein RL685_2102 [Pseudomonadota bacterium]